MAELAGISAFHFHRIFRALTGETMFAFLQRRRLLSKGNNVVLALPNGMPLEGGLRLLADDNDIGGIGVSVVQAPQDAQIAKAGADLLN